MDPVTMVYYGAVCGVLALWSPWVENRWTGFGIGIAVGIVAALIIPAVRPTLGL